LHGVSIRPLAHGSAPPLRAIERDIVRFSGARASRIGDAGSAVVGAHSHDWPILSIYVLGEHEKRHERGSDVVSGPAATLHLAGAPHANVVGASGFEQIDIEFDPAWLGLRLPAGASPVSCWQGGLVGAQSARLLRAWLGANPCEAELRRSTAAFLARALAADERPLPAWVGAAAARLRSTESPTTPDLVRMTGLSPAWLLQAYRAAYGEGVAETRLRGRVERALMLARDTDQRLCEIAAAVGFCDQSHMTRAFQRVLHRTPAEVRAEYRRAPQ
jgi:AraC family transcriptional regulator